MSFIARHMPKSIDDLVFRDPNVAKTIDEYALGQRVRHLLLYGPSGSGKSEAARILVDTLCPNTAGTAANEHINPLNFGTDGFVKVMNQWNMQMLCGATRGYVVIDEVDWFANKMMNELRGFTDDTRVGTIICTTNYPNALNDPLKNRFARMNVELPTVNDWLPRAKAIMATEGRNLTDDQMLLLLNGFEGGGRDLIGWLEEQALRLPTVAQNALTTFSVINGQQLTNSSPSNKAPPSLIIAE